MCLPKIFGRHVRYIIMQNEEKQQLMKIVSKIDLSVLTEEERLFLLRLTETNEEKVTSTEPPTSSLRNLNVEASQVQQRMANSFNSFPRC
jgi:hypothetical protein